MNGECSLGETVGSNICSRTVFRIIPINGRRSIGVNAGIIAAMIDVLRSRDPEKVTTDNGGEFVGQEFEAMLVDLERRTKS